MKVLTKNMRYTYRDVIELAIKDFESFFTEESGFSVSYEIGEGNFFAKIKGNALQSRLLFGKILAEQPIDTVDDIMFCLMIVGHELAHYVNKHNSYADQESIETVAIESWADYFGARIMFTLITFGDATKELLATFTTYASASPISPKVRQDVYLRSCGRALLRMYNTLFKQSDESDKYLRSGVRALTFSAGITSFFYRYFGEVKEKWTFFVYRRLVIDNGLANLAYGGGLKHEPQEFFERTRDIHIEIKGRENEFITSGLKLNYIRLIGTSYDDDEEGQRRRKQYFKEVYATWSFPVEV